MEDKLRILADWLKDAESGIDSYHDGQLEAAFKRAKQEAKQEIGGYLEEILEMDVNQIKNELKK